MQQVTQEATGGHCQLFPKRYKSLQYILRSATGRVFISRNRPVD